MISFLVIGTSVGIFLGIRFKVLSLAPATLIATGGIVATSHGIMTSVVTMLATTASLQIGYVLGFIASAYAKAYRQQRAALRNQLSKTKPAI
jgi:membrane protein DedA with SNARE-associated domain